MKRRGTKTMIGFLAVAVVIAGVFIAALLFLRGKRGPEGVSGQVIKHFSFSSTEQLDAWDEKLLAHNNTAYNVTEHAGRQCVKAEGVDSASALYYRQRLSWKKHPFVSWDWKAGQFPERKKKESLKKKGEFDFVAQVYVLFYSRFFLSTKAIQYVWTEVIPAGTVSPSPYTNNVRLIVLQSGPSEEWKHEERDIEEDYSRLFGESLKKDVVAVSFMTDSDSTETKAVAYYTNIKIGYLDKGEKKPAPGKELKKEKPWYLKIPVKEFLRKIFKPERKEKPSDT
ncbi:MAG: DUF3047 domain-containing protein [Candidatus Omnitrophica bacterium]|nr:DUF3047 domain-containing protein [Candidatus Omnitrophota bacterium]